MSVIANAAEASVTETDPVFTTSDTEDSAKTTGKLIYICSPYRPVQKASKKISDEEAEKIRSAEVSANIERVKKACRIVIALGSIPMAPHLYFTQFLDDAAQNERAKGIACGMRWLEMCDELWVFGSRTSDGMAAEIKRAKELGMEVRNMPEPERMVELLLEACQEMLKGEDESTDDETANVNADDGAEENIVEIKQQDATESEDNNE